MPQIRGSPFAIIAIVAAVIMLGIVLGSATWSVHFYLEIALLLLVVVCSLLAGRSYLQQAREVTAAAEERLANKWRLFTHGPVVLIRWSGSDNQPVEHASPNVQEVFGVSAGDLQAGRPLYMQTVHADDRQRINAEVASHVAAGHKWFTMDYRIVRPNGEVRWIFDTTEVVRRPDGAVLHFLGYVIDVTERHQTEQNLQRAQQLESLGVLAGGIAHDFNNLLVGVLGNAQMLVAELPKDSPLRSMAQGIEASGRRAAELTRQMLAYAGKGRFMLEPIDLSSLVQETADLLRASVHKRARLLFDLTAGLPMIEGDPSQIRQVVMNLITNASDAIGDKPGAIALTTHTFDCGPEDRILGQCGNLLAPGRYVVLQVNDDGCGMDAATVARIFEPFFTTKFTGRGLGLSAVLGIVRGHRGRIVVESQIGRGTRVSVYLPVTARPVVAPPAPSYVRDDRPTPEVRRVTVLVIDDEAAVREILQRVLEADGYRVLTAEDGVRGLALFEQCAEQIGLVLLDLTMPRGPGTEILPRLRALQPGLRVVVMSGFQAQDARAQFGAEEPTAFLEKPFTPAELRQMVNKVLALPQP